MSRIAAVVITKNEEHNIEDCLRSLSWADELIVVDAESTDRTVELAKAFTATVVVRPWPGYGPQKNFAMAQASADWVLIVDADERVSDELGNEILRVIRRPPSPSPSPSRGEGELVVAYRIPRRNFYYGRWIRHAGQYPDLQIRLLRRGAGLYNDLPVHEHLMIQGRIDQLQSHLDHYTHPTILSHELKIERYSRLAADERSRAGRGEAHWHHLMVNPCWTFLKLYLLKRGYRDGMAGVIYCLFSAAHVLLKYARLWEMTVLPVRREMQ